VRKITLFINGDLGLRILDYFNNRDDCEIGLIVTNSAMKRKTDYWNQINKRTANTADLLILEEYREGLWEDIAFRRAYEISTHAVSVFFGHLIPSKLLNKPAGRIINLHPSLLPVGRGADPIAWSILDGEKQGVSIHEISPEIDKGKIIFQNEIKSDLSFSAGQVYQIATEELWAGFNQIVDDWLNGELTLTNQTSGGTYHRSRELMELRNSLLEGSLEIERFVRTINALNFADGRRAAIRDTEGKTWQVEINLKEVEGNL
jgi:methionyl-tRNA formyltransferase